jgi:hypothetical protein
MMPALQNGINDMYATSNPAPYLFFFPITSICQGLAFCNSTRKKSILTCHQLLQKLASQKVLMLRQQMLDATDCPIMFQPQETKTYHCKSISVNVKKKSISVPLNAFSSVEENLEWTEHVPDIYRKCQITELWK